jgi:hypothetical protein
VILQDHLKEGEEEEEFHQVEVAVEEEDQCLKAEVVD